MKSKYRKYNNGGPVRPKKKSVADTSSVKINTDRDTMFVDSKGIKRRIIDLSLVNETDPYASDTLSTVNIKPRKVYNGMLVDPIFEEGREEANSFTKDMNAKVDSLYNTPNALASFQRRVMADMLRKAEPTDTSFYDEALGAMVSAGIYDPSDPRAESAYSYFKVSTDSDNPIKSVEKRRIRPVEKMVELPPKLPFQNMDLTKVPPLRRVLPEFYGMRLNQQTGEYIYDTSEGEIKKKIGPENAQFVNIHRKAIERMRKNR